MTMNVQHLEHELATRSGKRVELRLNANRSTMLSVVSDREPVRVSLHQMFLKAPSHVVQALAGFIQGDKQKRANVTIQTYIEEQLPTLNYSSRVDSDSLVTKGDTHDLRRIYNEINKTYFGGELNLHITWYGQRTRKRRNSLTFGLYHEPLKLVKINRLLDTALVPRYFVAYVVYHEVLHHVFPTYVGQDGRKKIHNDEFKTHEKGYVHYKKALEWLKQNRKALFDGKV